MVARSALVVVGIALEVGRIEPLKRAIGKEANQICDFDALFNMR